MAKVTGIGVVLWKFAWVLDPDGNKVELWEPKPQDELNKT